MKPSREKRTVTGRAREQCDRYAVGTHFENVIILHLEEAYYSESVGALDCYSAFQFWLHFVCNGPQTSTTS